MIRYDLTIGVVADSLESVRLVLFEQFSLSFEPRYSDYLGGDYYFAKNKDEEVRIQLNRDGDELAESDFPDHHVLVLIDGTESDQTWRDWAKSINGVVIYEVKYPVS